MADDRRRDRAAVRHGWVVLRVTWADVTDRPAATAQEIAAVVAGRSGLTA
jgi:very-short-patch-repair endonuclease